MISSRSISNRLIAMLDITLHTANVVFTVANIILVLGTVLVLAGTVGAIWSGSVKERFADERITTNEAQTAAAHADAERAKADSAKANESTEILRRANLALQGEVERERTARLKLEKRIAPRNLTNDQKSMLINSLIKFKGQKVSVNS